ncbi:MAG: hypothetical protein Devi2KO_40360 [Devosia indica]
MGEKEEKGAKKKRDEKGRKKKLKMRYEMDPIHTSERVEAVEKIKSEKEWIGR